MFLWRSFPSYEKSTKLISIILEVGPEILSSLELAMCQTAFDLRQYNNESMRELEKLLHTEKVKKRSPTFTDYFNFLLNHAKISLDAAAVLIKESDLYVMPFEEKHPDWWKSYNRLKHDKYASVKSATLRTVLKATSALFWIINSNSKHLTLKDSTE